MLCQKIDECAHGRAKVAGGQRGEIPKRQRNASPTKKLRSRVNPESRKLKPKAIAIHAQRSRGRRHDRVTAGFDSAPHILALAVSKIFLAFTGASSTPVKMSFTKSLPVLIMRA